MSIQGLCPNFDELDNKDITKKLTNGRSFAGWTIFVHIRNWLIAGNQASFADRRHPYLNKDSLHAGPAIPRCCNQVIRAAGTEFPCSFPLCVHPILSWACETDTCTVNQGCEIKDGIIAVYHPCRDCRAWLDCLCGAIRMGA